MHSVPPTADAGRGSPFARAGVAAACVIVTSLVVLMTARTGEEKSVVVQPAPIPPPQQTQIPADAAPAPIAIGPPKAQGQPAPVVLVEVIRDDPAHRRWQVVNDDQLLAALADAGRPSGLVRINGETMVVPSNWVVGGRSNFGMTAHA